MKDRQAVVERAEELWEEFGNTPINNDDEILEPFQGFPVGTDRFEVWYWFEEEFGVKVAYLLGYEDDPDIA